MLIKRVLTYISGSVGMAFFSFLTVPFMTRVMGPADYGKGRLYVVVVNFLFVLVSVGLDQSYSRFFYENKGHDSYDTLLKSCLAIVLPLWLLLSCVLYLFPSLVGFVIKDNSEHFILLIIVGLFLFVLNRFALLSLLLQKKSVVYSVGQTLNSALMLCTALILYYVFDINSFYLIIYAQLVSLLIVTLFVFCFDAGKWISLFRSSVPEDVDKKELLSFGWPFLFSLVLTWGFQNLDRILLLRLSNYHILGIYTAAFSLMYPALLVQGVFATVWLPEINERIANTKHGLVNYLERIHQILMALVSFVVLLLVACSHYIVMLLGEQYTDSAAVLGWILLTPFFYVLSEITMTGLLISKKSYWNIPITAISVGVNILLCFLLIPKYGAGGAGMALAGGFFTFYLFKTLFSFQYLRFRLHCIKLFFVITAMILMCILDSRFSWIILLSFAIWAGCFGHKLFKFMLEKSSSYLKV